MNAVQPILASFMELTSASEMHRQLKRAIRAPRSPGSGAVAAAQLGLSSVFLALHLLRGMQAPASVAVLSVAMLNSLSTNSFHWDHCYDDFAEAICHQSMLPDQCVPSSQEMG